MASSDVFRSSPIQGPRRAGLVIGSSSPGLPPLANILSQRSTRSPTLSSSKANPIPDGTPINFIPAKTPFESTEATPKLQPTKHGDDAIEIIQISRARKGGVKEANGAKKPTRKPKTTKGEKARKQPKSNANTTANELKNSEALSKDVNVKPSIKKKTGTTGNHFEQSTESSLIVDGKDADVNEPLNLEPATSRRVDWTPPGQKTAITIDSDSSALKRVASSECGDQPAFKDLVYAYSCLDQPPQTTSVPSDEESSFLKKRKRIELVAIQDGNEPGPEVPKKSPTKKKAPKKKARTITELATAAYKVPTQSDDEPPSATILDHFPSKSTDSAAAPDEKAKKGKGKANPRKRPSRAPKKKIPPPELVLLSPGAALDQVAKQDFVFGTSSQLAREPSPSVLRDIQAALRQSNQLEYMDMTTLVNSDDFELPPQRPRLWDAAARDADGDLFDVEVIDLAEGSPQLPQTSHEPDRFGYFKGGNPREASLDGPEVVPSDTVDSFVNLSDILPSPGERPVQIEGGDSPYFSESDMSTRTDIQPPANVQVELPHQSSKASTSRTSSSLQKPGAAELPPHPNYDLFTDTQLAKEVRSYGFKPIKKRSAMIAMLNQCWQSKVRLGQVSIHTSATQSAATPLQPAGSTTTLSSGKKARGRPRKNSIVTEPEVLPLTQNPGKRPRGRPRKNSVNASEPQEPPPSAQPPETPKRPRGRPRKESLSPSPTQPRMKPISPKKSAVVRNPARRKKATSSIIEIPDSASENGLELVSSPGSTIEQLSSSPPTLDLSLPATDDTELSLTASPNDQQAALFDHVTQAIKSAARTTDPGNPSWHEKILLYDPIVLEDLAAWLNSGELTRVGCDAEVSPGEVKKWCESKSVCCLWRVNLRGKQRKRF